MPLTLSKHIGLMRHALGAAPDSRHDLVETFNRAGRHLATYMPWNWTKVLNAAVTVNVSTVEAELPADFSSLIAVRRKDGLGLRLVDQSEMSRLREAGTFGATDAWYPAVCLQPKYEYSDLGVTAKKLQLSISSPAAFDLLIDYHRTWVEMASPGDDNKVPRIPPDFERALVLLARAHARELQDDVESTDMAAFASEAQRLMTLDASRQVDLGPMRGGATSPTRGWPLETFDDINLTG